MRNAIESIIAYIATAMCGIAILAAVLAALTIAVGAAWFVGGLIF